MKRRLLPLALLCLVFAGCSPVNPEVVSLLEFSNSGDAVSVVPLYINEDIPSLVLQGDLSLQGGEVIITVEGIPGPDSIRQQVHTESARFQLELESLPAATELTLTVETVHSDGMKLTITSPVKLEQDPETPAIPEKEAKEIPQK